MSVLKEVYNYLRKIKSEEISFQLLLNKGLKDIKQNEAFIIKDSLKSIVNKYFFLSWELDKIFKYDNNEIKDYLICALGQYHYVKEVNDEKLLGYLKEDMPLLDENFPIDEFYSKVKTLKNEPMKLSDKEEEIIYKKLAINYSYPEWVCKMMFKHFGVKKTYKTIASSRKNIAIAVNTNPLLCKSEKILEKYPSYFVKGMLTNNSLRYNGKEKIIDLDIFKKNYIFVEDEVSQMLVEKLNLEVNDTVLLVNDDRGAVGLDMALKIKDTGLIHVASSNVVNLNSTISLINRFNIKSINLFQSDVNKIITHVEKQTCDKVLFVAKSSQLGLVRRKPDVLLSLNRDNLDLLIKNQKEELLEMSNFVKSEGILIYAVFTYNKKESSMIVEDFLNNNKNFTLVEEKQIFAYEAPSDGVYYAILKKN